MTDDENGENGENGENPSGFEEHMLVYFRDPSLWPILAVVVLIAGTLGASLIVYAIELRNLFALAALAILIVASGHALIEQLRARRFGAPSWIVAALWTASFTIAFAARMAGIF